MAKSWKKVEARIAKMFGSTRTPLSGGNSKHTRSDSLSPHFFIETKSRKKDAAYALYLKTRPLARKEGKPPMLALCLNNHPGALICVHSDDLQTFIKACIDSGVYNPDANAGATSAEVAQLPELPLVEKQIAGSDV